MSEKNTREIITEFAEIFYHLRNVRKAFEMHVSAEKYIQHNPTIADGREAAILALHDKFGHPNANFEVKKILVDGMLAVVHVRAFPSGGKEAAVADFYRLENGKIVEHWDVVQVAPENPSNSNTMF
jgi:predicted SnoaL-like aldol condensation-catalyzing enzyme